MKNANRNSVYLITIMLFLFTSISLSNLQNVNAELYSGTEILTNSQNLSGLQNNNIKIQYMDNATKSTPIVIIAEGLGASMGYLNTLQKNIAQQGFVTVGFDAKMNVDNNQFVINEKTDIDYLLNWILADNLSVGNKNNICLLGQSAGGGCVLTFGNDVRISSILAVAPANFGVSVPVNTRPVMVIVGQADTEYAQDGITFYKNLVEPKIFLEIRNGTHYLGITDNIQILPTSYTQVVEKYIFAFLKYTLEHSISGFAALTQDLKKDANILDYTYQGVYRPIFSGKMETQSSDSTTNPIPNPPTATDPKPTTTPIQTPNASSPTSTNTLRNLVLITILAILSIAVIISSILLNRYFTKLKRKTYPVKIKN